MDWVELDRELDRWEMESGTATFWWRDDDAYKPSSALDRLLDVAGSHGVVMALAVIPALAEESLAHRLAGAPTQVLQHGYAHKNHAPSGQRAIECGGARTLSVV